MKTSRFNGANQASAGRRFAITALAAILASSATVLGGGVGAEPVASDFDGDGVNDLIVRRPAFNSDNPLTGSVRVYSGQTRQLLVNLTGQMGNDLFGLVASSAGQIDLDLIDDVVVGAPDACVAGQGAGRVYVYSGASTQIVSVFDGLPGSHLGRSVAGAGDINGDGVNDLLLGAFAGDEAGYPLGIVYAVSGSTGEVIRSFLGDQVNDGFGFTIAGLGDINADGAADIAISAPNSFVAPGIRGRVYVFYGYGDNVGPPSLTASQANVTVTNTSADIDLFARVLSAASDLNGDGGRDLLIVSRRKTGGNGIAGGDLPELELAGVSTANAELLAQNLVDTLSPTGDADADLIVDSYDIATVLAGYGQVIDPEEVITGDLDASGVVGPVDLAITLADQGTASAALDFSDQQMVLATEALDLERETQPPGDEGGIAGAVFCQPVMLVFYPGFDTGCQDPGSDPCDTDLNPDGDCDGDGCENWADPDWAYWYFREPLGLPSEQCECPKDDPTEPCIEPVQDPWASIAQLIDDQLVPDIIIGTPCPKNDPLDDCWEKCHPDSDPDRDGIPNSSDDDDDGDGIPDLDEPGTECDPIDDDGDGCYDDGEGCGDDVCDPDETAASCATDCGDLPGCNNGVCEPELGETAENCPGDCEGLPDCGDGDCDEGETEENCPIDCGEDEEECADCNVVINDAGFPTSTCTTQPLFIPIDIWNTGECDADFSWEMYKLAGTPAVLITPSAGTVSVPADGGIRFWVDISLFPPHGWATLEVDVYLDNDLYCWDTIEVLLVPPDCDAELGNGSGDPGDVVQLPCSITNEAQCQVSYQWSITKEGGAVVFGSLPSGSLTLEPGETIDDPVSIPISASSPQGTGTLELAVSKDGEVYCVDLGTVTVSDPCVQCNADFGVGPDIAICYQQPTTVPFSLTNNGDCEATFNWTMSQGSDPVPNLSLQPASGSVFLDVGQTYNGLLTVTGVGGFGWTIVVLEVFADGQSTCESVLEVNVLEPACGASLGGAMAFAGGTVQLPASISNLREECPATVFWELVQTGGPVVFSSPLPTGSITIPPGDTVYPQINLTVADNSPCGYANLLLRVYAADGEYFLCAAPGYVQVIPASTGFLGGSNAIICVDTIYELPFFIQNNSCPSAFTWRITQIEGEAQLQISPSEGVTGVLSHDGTYNGVTAITVPADAPPGEVVFRLEVFYAGILMWASQTAQHIVEIDLDVDSDNTNGLGLPDQSDTEDEIEDNPGETGKLIIVNNADSDGDGIPDFADGFNLVPGAGADDDDVSPGDAFVPLPLTISEGFDWERSRIVFNYSASAPSGVTISDQSGAPVFNPAAGHMRLWRKNGSAVRNPANIALGGDYIVSGYEYLPEHLGLAPDGGVATLWVEAVRESAAVGGHTIDVSIDDCTDAVRLTAFGMRMRELVPGGTLEVVQHPQASHPTPVITLTQCELTNVRPSPDSKQILADLHLAGTVDDAVRDMMAGQDGLESPLALLLNGGAIEDGNGQPISLPITWVSLPTSPTLAKPYDYIGSFATQVSGITVEVIRGFNTIEVLAANKHGFAGYAERTIEIEAEPPPDEQIDVTIFAYGGEPNWMTLAITVTADGEVTNYRETLTEDPENPGHYVNVLGGIVDIVPPVNPLDVEEMVIWLTHDDLDLVEEPIWLTKPDPFIDTFVGDTLIEEVNRPDWEDYTFSIGESSLIFESTGGEFSPFYLEVLGPPDLGSLLTEVSLGDISYSLTNFQGAWYLDRPGGVAMPESFFAIRTLEETLEEEYGPWRDGFWNLVQGFGVGLYDTGVDIGDTVVTVGEGAWYLIWNYNTFVVVYRVTTGGQIVLEEDQQRISAAWETVQTIATIANQIRQHNDDVIYAVLTGDDESLQALGEDYRLAAEFAVELLEAIDQELSEIDDYEAGRIMGRIVGEVVVQIIGIVTTGGAANVLKSAKAAAVISKLNSLPDTTIPPSIKAKLLALLQYFQKMANTKMCFVAGTLVHTAVGPVPIEAICQGDLVLSRCPHTGEQGYRRVIDTVLTHPSTLYDIEYTTASHGGGEAPESVKRLRCTGEHPFYSATADAFVPARELRPGDVMQTASGTEAHVTDIRVERGPPRSGGSFTTYNIEVADWHTYFVAPVGHETLIENGGAVWVHNASDRPCERTFAIYERIKEKHGLQNDPVEAMKKTVEKFAAISEAKKMDAMTLRSFALDVMRQTYENPPMSGGMIDFAKINYNRVHGALTGSLPGADLEVHHIVTKQWSERLYQLVHGDGAVPPEGFPAWKNKMPSVAMPRKWHNFTNQNDPNMPGLESFHKILDKKLPKKPIEYEGEAGKQQILIMLQQAYEDFAAQYSQAAPPGWEFDFQQVWAAGQQWLVSEGLQ